MGTGSVVGNLTATGWQTLREQAQQDTAIDLRRLANRLMWEGKLKLEEWLAEPDKDGWTQWASEWWEAVDMLTPEQQVFVKTSVTAVPRPSRLETSMRPAWAVMISRAW